MRRTEPQSERLLGDDFAVRVLGRVDRVRRRRMIVRGSLAAAAFSTAVVLGLFARAPRFDTRASSSVEPAEAAAVELPDTYTDNTRSRSAMALFFPDVPLVAEFVQKSDESAWHSYDPWWTSNS
jgi:hypothetical protein